MALGGTSHPGHWENASPRSPCSICHLGLIGCATGLADRQVLSLDAGDLRTFRPGERGGLDFDSLPASIEAQAGVNTRALPRRFVAGTERLPAASYREQFAGIL